MESPESVIPRLFFSPNYFVVEYLVWSQAIKYIPRSIHAYSKTTNYTHCRTLVLSLKTFSRIWFRLQPPADPSLECMIACFLRSLLVNCSPHNRICWYVEMNLPERSLNLKYRIWTCLVASRKHLLVWGYHRSVPCSVPRWFAYSENYPKSYPT